MERSHPLFPRLRQALYWHCTGPAEYEQILMDGFIRPNDGRVKKWGCYACQELGAVSIFDFHTPTEDIVLGEALKWRMFLTLFRPLTIIIGLDPARIPGHLVRYPHNKEGTIGNLIPWVEVCHVGPIPFNAMASHLLVCKVDDTQFHAVGKVLTRERVAAAQKEFGGIVQAEAARRESNHPKLMETILQDPDLRARIQAARERIKSLQNNPGSELGV
ncbi:MAG: hypothetical protein JWM16_532 [Verrucomicrobiales bacterium]|nr:hypothetical protein [Verrucomicrobiales bacterium]